MKTFIAALCLFAVTLGFVIWNTVDLQKTFEEMIALTEELPFDAEDFKKDSETEETVEKLYRLWDKKFPRLVIISAYENLNRADEALNALFIHYQNNNANDFTNSRLLFWDSLHRMQTLEGFSFGSIF